MNLSDIVKLLHGRIRLNILFIQRTHRFQRLANIKVLLGEISQLHAHLLHNGQHLRGLRLEERHKAFRLHHAEHAFRQADGCGASGHIVQNAHFTEHLIRAQLRQQLFIAGLVIGIDADISIADIIQAIRRIAGAEDHAARRKTDHRGSFCGQRLLALAQGDILAAGIPLALDLAQQLVRQLHRPARCDMSGFLFAKGFGSQLGNHGKVVRQFADSLGYAGHDRLKMFGMVVEIIGKIIVADDLLKAIDIANEIAPEHLEICVDNPFDYLDKIKHAGSIFMGKYCPEALGDYYAGPNHTLPTSGTARFSSPLSVDDFVKKTQYTYYTRDALSKVASDVAFFAEKEGLTAHAKSATIRFEEEK